MGIVLYRQGKQAEAEALEREVLAMRINTLGKDHPQVAMSLLNLAAFLQAEGKLAEAGTVSRQALDANRKAFGSEHQYVTTALDNLGCVLCLEGKLVEAEGIVREVVNGIHRSNAKNFTVRDPAPGTGSLVVNLSPAGAVAAGAQWQVDGTG